MPHRAHAHGAPHPHHHANVTVAHVGGGPLMQFRRNAVGLPNGGVLGAGPARPAGYPSEVGQPAYAPTWRPAGAVGLPVWTQPVAQPAWLPAGYPSEVGQPAYSPTWRPAGQAEESNLGVGLAATAALGFLMYLVYFGIKQEEAR